MTKLSKLTAFVFIFLVSISFVFAEKELPELTLALGDGGPATDVLLLTQIGQYLSEEDYENLPQGITKLFSDIDSLDEMVIIVVYEGEVEIIVGDGSPDDYEDFADDLGDILDEKDVPYKISKSEELETLDLVELYDIELEEPEPVQIVENTTPEPIAEPVVEPILEPEPVVVEEPPKSFFQKIIDWFKNLFS